MDTSSVDDFIQFLKQEISPATLEIGKLDDSSRKHIQKLIYTNLVDRFDTMVDRSILLNCREESFSDDALKSADKPVSEADLYRLLMQGNDLQKFLTTRLQDGLRNSVLRNRHSLKLKRLLEVVSPDSEGHKQIPRVNISTGDIVDKFKPQNKKIPHSVAGYADWLYSRRNSIVHGAGSNKFLDNDQKQIKKIWKTDTTKTFKISVGSITIATKFYSNVAEMLKNQ